MARSTAGRSASSFQRKFTCRLPSPAWPYVRWRTPVSLADAIDLDEQIDEARARDDDVLGELVLRKLSRGRRELRGAPPRGARAAPRPARRATSMRLPPSVQRVAEALERVVEQRAASPSTSMRSIAPARAGRSATPCARTASSVAPSISSRQRGTRPRGDDRAARRRPQRGTSAKSASTRRHLGRASERAAA